MATSTDSTAFEVPDEGDIDASFKRRIVSALERVDDREDYLYVQAPVETGMQVSNLQQDIYWGMIVKQYLRTIEQLLRADEIEYSDYYYKQVKIGEVELIPQNTGEVPFQDYINGMVSKPEFCLRHDIAEGAELPSVETEPFEGLKSVLESDGVVSHTWRLPRTDGGVITTTAERAVPKYIYEKAVRHSLEFLQKVGIGIDIDPEPYMGGEEPGL